MSITKQIKLELDVWCTDERHFDELLQELKRIHFYENAMYGGYGFELHITSSVENKLRKKLEFPKDCEKE